MKNEGEMPSFQQVSRQLTVVGSRGEPEGTEDTTPTRMLPDADLASW